MSRERLSEEDLEAAAAEAAEAAEKEGDRDQVRLANGTLLIIHQGCEREREGDRVKPV